MVRLASSAPGPAYDIRIRYTTTSPQDTCVDCDRAYSISTARKAMKAIRRSIKGEKDTKPHHLSITPKSAIAIVPPKKVIKALYDYQPEPQNTDELGFHKGDFFHVISREDDPNWYEACNPLIPSARGLVPVSYFDIIGKTERQSAGSTASGSSNPILPHDSGYSEAGSHRTQESSCTARGSMGKGPAAMVYGIVQYDFNAERPDELEAKQGEYIIIIAQSNPEWFVAKPIGRLGGPGLIPATFVEIRDMATEQPVADAQEAIRRAGVPKVEEWKKMATDYKNGSIALGKIEANTGAAQRGLERLSLNNGNQQHGGANGNSHTHKPGYHPKNGSRHMQNLDRSSVSPWLAPVSASIPRYCFENDKYWYIIECVMEDGRHWELSRFYQNFYDFQIALLQQFPKEADSSTGQRLLPYMPGPVTYVTDAISNGRRQSLDEYVQKLLSLPPYISRCQLVRELFAPRDGDFELDPRAAGEDFRLSGASQRSSARNSEKNTVSRQSSVGQINGNNGYQPASIAPSQARSNHQRNQSSVPATSATVFGQQTHWSPPVDVHPSNSLKGQASSLTQASNTSSGPVNASTTNVNSNTTAPNTNLTGALKIKVFFEDDLIAIRVPSDIDYQRLKDKLMDRLKLQEEIMISYKDEPSGSYAELLSDRDLDVALLRNQKLTLYVGYV